MGERTISQKPPSHFQANRVISARLSCARCVITAIKNCCRVPSVLLPYKHIKNTETNIFVLPAKKYWRLIMICCNLKKKTFLVENGCLHFHKQFHNCTLPSLAWKCLSELFPLSVCSYRVCA